MQDGRRQGLGLQLHQGPEESGFFQCIGHVVGLQQQLYHRLPARLAFGALACLHHQAIGTVFPALDARHQLAAVLLALRDQVAHGLRQRMAVGGMFRHQVEFQMVLRQCATHQQTRLVLDHGLGLLLQQQRGTHAHQLQQELARTGIAQYAVQPVTKAEGIAADCFHGAVDQLFAARHQPAHVAMAACRSALQQVHGGGLVDEQLQALARAVPVDHEHDARRHVFQTLLQRGIVLGVQRGLAHGIGLVLVHARRHDRFRHFPAEAGLFQQALEELEADHVQLGIGQADAAALDRDHQHVGIVGTDVVLDQQAFAVTRDSGVQARVAELERCRAVQSAHEGAYQRTVFRLDMPDMGAIQVLGGNRAGQTVDLLVQIHYQQVEAVARGAIAMGQAVQVGGTQAIVITACLQPVMPVCAARAEAFGICHDAAIGDRTGHGFQIIVQRLQQLCHVRQHQQLVVHIGVSHQILGPAGLAEAGTRQFLAPVDAGLVCRQRMARGGLQQREIEFEPVIGCQCGSDPGGHQQRLLTERGNGFVFLQGRCPGERAAACKYATLPGSCR